jgi:hypothetical protein
LDKYRSTQPAARPVSITRFSYLGGGGGRDPDPALDIVDSLAHKKGKIYLICSVHTAPSQADSVQKRIWLAQIRNILANQHPAPQEIIFGEETQSPVRLMIFK